MLLWVLGTLNEGNKNRRKGFDFERRFLAKRKKQGATRTVRHYGSFGVTDVEWTDQLGFKHEAQLKYSSKGIPKVSPHDRLKIQDYAAKKKKLGIKVWIVCKMSRGPEVWEAVN